MIGVPRRSYAIGHDMTFVAGDRRVRKGRAQVNRVCANPRVARVAAKSEVRWGCGAYEIVPGARGIAVARRAASNVCRLRSVVFRLQTADEDHAQRW